MEKQYMVFGIKDNPEKDTQSEKDNPYLFNSLARAFEVAQEVAKEFSYARVVKIETVEIINYGCQA